jgi:hypothetical protein
MVLSVEVGVGARWVKISGVHKQCHSRGENGYRGTGKKRELQFAPKIESRLVSVYAFPALDVQAVR